MNIDPEVRFLEAVKFDNLQPARVKAKYFRRLLNSKIH